MRLIFIFIFFCLTFCAYGKNSSVTSDTVRFFSNKLPVKSPVTGNMLLIDTGYGFPVTSPIFGNSPGFLFYPGQKQVAKPVANFKYNVAESEAGISLVNNHTFSISPVSTLVSFSPKTSKVPLLRNENAGVWRKIGRAEFLVGGAELVSMSILIAMPKKVTKWSDDWMQSAWGNMKKAFSKPPVWDKDDWPLNYIGHPIAGSYYYNAVRSQNADWFPSFLFGTFQSFFWEYVIEGAAERPSTQDLVVTPIAGVILGEATHLLTMNMRRNGFSFFEKAFVLIFNPMFVFNNGFGPRHNPVRVRN